jgi:TP901 family phage tail tape measure protein
MFRNTHSVLGLGVSVFLRDDFTRNAAKIRKSFDSLAAHSQKQIIAQTTAIRDRGLGMALAGTGMLYGMRQAVMAVKDFDAALHLTIGVGGMGGTAKQYEDSMRRLKAIAIDLSRTVPYTATEISQGFTELAKGGVGLEGMQKMTKAMMLFASAADLPQIGGEEGAANILLNIMAQYGKTFDEAQLVVDKMTKAFNMTTVDAAQVYETFKYATPFLRMYNMTLDETLAITAGIAQSGLKGSISGTTFGNFYTYLAEAVGSSARPKQKKALARLGLTPADFIDPKTGGFKPSFEMLTKLQEGLQKLPLLERNSALLDLFGKRGARESNLFQFLKAESTRGTPAKTLQELIKSLEDGNVAKEAENVNKIRMESYAAKIQLFNNAIFELADSFSEAIMPIVIPAMRLLAEAFRGLAAFGKTGLGKVLMAVTALGVVLYTLTGVLTFFFANRLLGKLTAASPGFIDSLFLLARNMQGKFSYFNRAGRLISGFTGTFLKKGMGWKWLLDFFSFKWFNVANLSKIIRFIPLWGKIAIGIGALLFTLYKFSDGFHNMVVKIKDSIVYMFKVVVAYGKWFFRNFDFSTTTDQNDAMLRADLAAARGDVNAGVRGNYGGKDAKTQLVMEELLKFLKDSEGKAVQVTIVDPRGRTLSTSEKNRADTSSLIRTTGYKP